MELLYALHEAKVLLLPKKVTSEFAVASDFDTQHAVATAASLIHLGLCAVP